MKRLFLLMIAMVLSISISSTHAEPKTEFRDLIVFLAVQNEPITNNNTFVRSQLMAAIQQKNTPILTSASLWHTFIETQQDFLVHRQIPDSNEAKMFILVENINNRLNYWYQLLYTQTSDPIHSKAVALEQINAEFYVPDAYKQLKDDNKIPTDSSAERILAQCSVLFEPNDWYVFIIHNNYYLLIPKTYASRYTTQTEPCAIAHDLGFQTNALELTTNPLDTAWLLYSEQQSVDQSILPAFQALFSPHSATSYAWCLYIAGHGYHSEYQQTIAEINVKTFCNLCTFLNDTIHVHTLWLSTCYAGGRNKQLFTEEMHYKYPIIIESLGDFPTYAQGSYIKLPNGKDILQNNDIIENPHTNRWGLSYISHNNFVKFFNYMHNFTAVNGSDNLINKALLTLRGTEWLENTPQLLLPNGNKKHLQYSQYSQYIDINQVLIAELSKKPLVLNKHSILIDTPYILAPLLISHEMPKYIISTTPGATQYYIATLNASTIPVYEVIKSFWPLSNSICNKIFLIDTLICSINPKDPLAMIIGATESTMTFTQVMIRVIKSDQLRIIFTTQKGTFSATMRKLSEESSPQLRNPQRLSIEASEKYSACYNGIQSQCMKVTETYAYKQLKMHYAQALGLAVV